MAQDNFKRYYRRHLPHHHPEGKPLFITWNLKGAIPDSVKNKLKQLRYSLENDPYLNHTLDDNLRLKHAEELFKRIDNALDHATEGPYFLRDEANAEIVVDAILFGIPERYELYAFVVMPNHVHILVNPVFPMRKLMQGLKGYTSHEINKLHDRKGHTVWQDESYDHWIRSEQVLLEKIEYIEYNPVKAGLCKNPDEWMFSSAFIRKKLNWNAGEVFRVEWKVGQEKVVR